MSDELRLGLAESEFQPVSDELTQIKALLNTQDSTFLELGCGAAYQTRAIAENTNVQSIIGVEIDPIQHNKNLLITDLPKVTFKSYGAERIEEEDACFDAVIMLKSLHHVPRPELPNAFREIHRVLKRDALAYISEPVFAGEFNEVMRIFHDEQEVRLAAFNAIKQAIAENLFYAEAQVFFKNKIKLASFAQYEAAVLDVSHTEHNLSDKVLARVKEKFLSNETEDGFIFYQPNRINLLRKI